MHLTRRAIRTDDGTAALLPLLLERCRANLNKYVVASVPNAEHLRETILCDFAALFAMDGTVDDKFWALDFFECRFNLAFASFRQTRVTNALKQEARQITLPSEEGEIPDGEINDELLGRLLDLQAGGDPEHRLVNAQTRQQVLRAVWGLPENERKAVVLVYA